MTIEPHVQIFKVTATNKELQEYFAPRYTKKQVATILGVSTESVRIYDRKIARNSLSCYRKTTKPRRKISKYHIWILGHIKSLVAQYGTHLEAKQAVFANQENYSIQAFLVTQGIVEPCQS